VARAEDLLAKNLSSEQTAEDLRAQLAAADARVDVQEAQVKAAEATVGVAEANLGNTLIRAPFTGTVLRKDAEVGEVVAPVATGGGLTRGAVVTMADLETLEVEVDVNEAYIAQIRDAQPARIILDAYPSAWSSSRPPTPMSRLTACPCGSSFPATRCGVWEAKRSCGWFVMVP
jgi:multidrug resistance efflux pump